MAGAMSGYGMQTGAQPAKPFQPSGTLDHADKFGMGGGLPAPQYQYQNGSQNWNSNTPANTTNLGYSFPGGGGNNMNTGWLWNSTPNPAQSGQGGGGSFGGQSGAGGGGNDPYSLQNLINMQMQQNNTARQQNQNNWDSSKNYMLGIPGMYNGQASTQGAQSLTNQLAANPLSLSPAVVQQMKNSTANQISAQGDNQFRNVRRAMSADGQTDTSSNAAALEAQNRANLGAQTSANTAIDIEAAKQRPIDLANAAGVAQRQSGQDIGVPMGVGNSIMSNLPQVRPDDYSGLLALTNQMQNQQFQNQMLANQNGLRTPTAYNPIGGQYRQGGQGGGAGFDFQNPFTGQSPNQQQPGSPFAPADTGYGYAGPNTTGMMPRGYMQAFATGGNDGGIDYDNTPFHPDQMGGGGLQKFNAGGPF